MINLVHQTERERPRRALNQREHNAVAVGRRHAVDVRRVNHLPIDLGPLRVEPRVPAQLRRIG